MVSEGEEKMSAEAIIIILFSKILLENKSLILGKSW